MKKIIAAIAVILFPMMLYAQSSPLEKLFNKYNGREGYTTVSINQGMFDLFSSIANDKDDKDFKDITSKLTAFRILTCEAKVCDDLYKEACTYFTAPEYQDLMTVNDGDESVRFLVHKHGDRISELVMAVGGKEPCIMWLQGDIDLKQISKLSKSMNIGGIDKLGDLSAKSK